MPEKLENPAKNGQQQLTSCQKQSTSGGFRYPSAHWSMPAFGANTLKPSVKELHPISALYLYKIAVAISMYWPHSSSGDALPRKCFFH